MTTEASTEIGPAAPPSVESFRATMGCPFELDAFQKEALAALAAGRSVLVSAPTSAGKTVVAEYAVLSALRTDGRCFYTTPLKALSNQKFRDFCGRFGEQNVGLLTGDNAIRAHAPVVVMTTEVLRNMLYSRSQSLAELRYVVLDEVHYLQDPYRGPVWEEVIIHLPPEVRLVCLSATISNAEEVAAWLGDVHGETAVVCSEERPVPLENLYLVGDRERDKLHLVPLLRRGRPHPSGERFNPIQPKGMRHRRRRWYTPSRLETIELLAQRDLLPAIYFIFSRQGCDEAASALARSGMSLVTPEQADLAEEALARALEQVGEEDLDALGVDRLREQVRAGVAPHHAGMVPPFKEAIEHLFAEGLLKVVFATETLALGVNMPARSVVIEKLSRFRGEGHSMLTPAEYTQMTGRAGRRGVDTKGFAVCLWSPFVSFQQVARLAGSRSFQLRSAFRPTYNMTANLVRSHTREEAEELLAMSLAQYQADRDVVRLERRLGSMRAKLRERLAEAECERGDVRSVAASASLGVRRRRERLAAELSRLKPGQVVRLGGDTVVVLAVSERRGRGPKLHVCSDKGVLVVSSARVDEPPRTLGRIELPTPFEPQRPDFVREVRARLRRFQERSREVGVTEAGEGSESETTVSGGDVADCPDLRRHLRALHAAERLEREIHALEKVIASKTDTLTSQFERVLDLLRAWDYVEGEWMLTERGEILAGVFHECDLLVAESICEGILDDLGPEALAGVVSCLTYEHRAREEPPEPWFPDGETRSRFVELEELSRALNEEERARRLPLTRSVDPSFLPVVHAWCTGAPLDVLLEEFDEVSGGDFVRNTRQVIDLLQQIATVTAGSELSDRAVEAARRLERGVVAVSSALG
ncbi:MAG: ATP-dependent RNA helicase [Acidimicrobiales bacterium]|nr:MAG: ATP-dependent RNA helicase [Acidimicrobiales bacterium]